MKNNLLNKLKEYLFVDKLKFYHESGVGHLNCNFCNHTEEILFNEHDFDQYSITGYQCRTCGKLHRLEDLDDEITVKCDCGGLLSRENDIFCPKCHSFDVTYEMEYMT